MKTERPIKEFLAEAEDILESVSRSLLSLDEERSAGGPAPDAINGLFRSVHSFKGLAGVFGLKPPADLAHKLETLLDEMRLGKIALSNDVMDVLFDTTSVLGRLVKQAGEGRQFEDIAAAVSSIDAVLKSASSAPHDRSILERIGIDKAVLQVLTEYEEYRLIENLHERKNIFRLKASFDLSDFEGRIKKLNALLKQHGEIICTLPSAEAGTGIGFTIIVGTGESAESIAALISDPGVVIEQVPYAAPEPAQPAQAQRTEAQAIRSASNTVRVDIYKLDSLMNIVADLHLVKNAVGRIATDLRAYTEVSRYAADLNKVHRNFERKLHELQDGILDVRMVPIGQIFTRLAQVVRRHARESGKEIKLELMGEETELDKLMIEDLADPLMHLIRNAIDHGVEPAEERRRRGKPEQGLIRLTAYPKGNHVVIAVEDDGRGMDPSVILAKAVEKGLIGADHGLDPAADRKEVLDLIFLPGFSTSEKVTEISGRGVGMDVVKKNVSKLSGIIDIETESGVGTRFVLTLPITLAIINALVIEAGGQVFSIPLSSVLEIVRATPEQVQTVEAREVMVIRDETVPLLRLSQVFGLPNGGKQRLFYVILVGLAERRLGLVVDRLRDQQNIVIKPLGKRLASTPGIAGASELSAGDRRVVLVLDVESLIDAAFKKGRQ